MYKISYFILLIIILVGIYFLFFIKNTNNYQNNQENFTPKINSLYRPQLRKIRVNYETFTNNYGF